MRFYNMKSRPLEFDVKCGSKVVIPAGAKNVKIAFRQSHLKRFDETLGHFVNLNAYIYKGKIYHA